MQQIYPDASLVPILQRFLAGDLHYHLFSNNVTPGNASVLGDFTEAVYGTYAPITVIAADFTLTGVAGHVGGATAAAIAFLNDSGGDLGMYGYYVTDTSNTILIAAARFDSAPAVKHNGESWIITPTFGDFSAAA